MTRIASLALVVLATVASLGATACRTAHLGPDGGATTRAAFTAQRASHPEAAPAFGAADAHATLAAQRSAKGRAEAPAGLTAGALVMPAAGGGADWQGSKAPISLEAK